MRVPDPVPLPDPPGDPAALSEVVHGLLTAAFRTGVLVPHLSGPAASAPGWHGTDAAAAGAQVAATRTVADQVHALLTASSDRLGAHRDLLEQSRARLVTLRDEQAADRLAGQVRLDALSSVTTGQPPPQALAEAQAVCDEVATADALRAQEHGRLLDEVAADAAAAAAGLATVVAVVGGAGVPGDAARVAVHLVGLLPAWGEAEMTRLGRDAATELLAAGPAEDIVTAAQQFAAHADDPVFAATVVQVLGVEGIRHLLAVLGMQAVGGQALPAFLARVLDVAGDVDPSRPTPVLVRSDGEPGTEDVVVAGLATVLAAGTVGPRQAGAWATQLLAWEAARGAAGPVRLPPSVPDPLQRALAAAAGDPRVAASLLAEADTWRSVLVRPWRDGGDAVVSLVHAATGAGAVLTAAPAAAAARAAAQLLPAMEAGDPAGLRAQELVVRLSEDTAVLLAASMDGLSVTLAAGRDADGREWSTAEHEVVTGLGVWALVPAARVVLVGALTDWASAVPVVTVAGVAQVVPYVQGAFLSAIAIGEEAGARMELLADLRDMQSAQLLWDVVTWPLGLVPFAPVQAVDRYVLPFQGPDDPSTLTERALTLTAETGPTDARRAAVATALPALVAAGVVPRPDGLSLEELVPVGDRGPYAELLVWTLVTGAAEAGYNDVRDRLEAAPPP